MNQGKTPVSPPPFPRDPVAANCVTEAAWVHPRRASALHHVFSRRLESVSTSVSLSWTSLLLSYCSARDTRKEVDFLDTRAWQVGLANKTVPLSKKNRYLAPHEVSSNAQFWMNGGSLVSFSIRESGEFFQLFNQLCSANWCLNIWGSISSSLTPIFGLGTFPPTQYWKSCLRMMWTRTKWAKELRGTGVGITRGSKRYATIFGILIPVSLLDWVVPYGDERRRTWYQSVALVACQRAFSHGKLRMTSCGW